VNSGESYLQQEVDWIENSGEMPEVAFYEALYCLTEEEEGPKLTLTLSDIKRLEDAAINRLYYSPHGSRIPWLKVFQLSAKTLRG